MPERPMPMEYPLEFIPPSAVPPAGCRSSGTSPSHRAQAGRCLRLLENRVPPTYGPTADVTWTGADATAALDAARRRGT